VISLVQHCVERNLSIKDTLEIISSHLGYPFSGKTLQRIKKELPKSNKQQLEIIDQDTASFIFESMNKLKTGEQIVIKIAEDSAVHPWIKVQAVGMMSKIRRHMADLYDSSPIIASLSNQLAGRKDVFQEHTKITGNEQLCEPSPSS